MWKILDSRFVDQKWLFVRTIEFKEQDDSIIRSLALEDGSFVSKFDDNVDHFVDFCGEDERSGDVGVVEAETVGFAMKPGCFRE